jgi:hypothetical protein
MDIIGTFEGDIGTFEETIGAFKGIMEPWMGS